MADIVQVALPAECTPLIEEIREERIKRLEEKSNVSILRDAVKMMHKNITKGRK